MNRRVFIQVVMPALIIGLVLLGSCLISAWHIDRLQGSLKTLLSRDFTILEAGQELEINMRKLRFHHFAYLTDPKPARLQAILEDHEAVEYTLEEIKGLANTVEEQRFVNEFEQGYSRYRDELAALRARAGPDLELPKQLDAHPVRHVMESRDRFLDIHKEAMAQANSENASFSGKLRWTLLLLGLGGPMAGLIIGFAVARGLSQSIYKLNVHVQGIAERLDHEVASVSIATDGDMGRLDRQLEHIVSRVGAVMTQLQQQERELLHSEQLAAVGQLAASVAHEVRNPLTGLKMLIDSALRSANRSQLTIDDLQAMHEGCQELEQKVQAFLDFARPPSLQPRSGDLRDVVGQALDLVRARAHQQGVSIDSRADDQPLPVFVDAGQLRTVLVNLFLNALDEMPHGGRLAVRMTRSDEMARVEILDTGQGISDRILDRLFTPFSSSKPTGTGLGLSISRRIMEEHGGSISAANRPGHGACFTLLLPLLREEVHAKPARDR